MSQQQAATVENNFTGGLKTEFTGLNFPENACTDVENCLFTLIGNVERRGGIDYESNYSVQTIQRSGNAISTYKWLNVGGDGSTQVLVLQVGGTLYFFQYTNATTTNPLSTTKLTSTVGLSGFLPVGSSNSPNAVECQYSQGNGYLFVYHPYLDPFYCTFNNNGSVIISNKITVQIRDFIGIYPEPGSPVINYRPNTLTNEHNYNLQNQGWTSAPTWSATSSTYNLYVPSAYNLVYLNTGSQTFTISSGLSISPGTPVTLSWRIHYVVNQGGYNYDQYMGATATGNVTSYSGTTLVLVIGSYTTTGAGDAAVSFWDTGSIVTTISSANTINTISTWNTALGNYPSNADIWYTFKNSSDVFDPASTYSNVNLTSTQAPGGRFILSAFNQDHSGISGIGGLTSITTSVRPRTGTWFQGRVWYTGVDSSQATTGDVQFYTWTENLYFSQIITDSTQFGNCFQQNDPTSEQLFDLLPDDGGVIVIQGCGAIYKLFPVQNGLLVFAANGIWFITGSQGIGFAANDYTITKISAIQSISSTSFIDMLGWPVFWNEEGIYTVNPSKQGGGLEVTNLCLGTILSYYNNIPLLSKKFVRGDYNPITFVISWVFRSTNESTITNRYEFDTVLNFNTVHKAFYPYQIVGTTPKIHDIKYIVGPGGSTSPDPVFKYLTSVSASGSYNFTFSEERDQTHWVDFYSYDNTGVNYVSYFVTGYKLHGGALRKFQPEYVYVFSDNSLNTSYKIQGIWEYSILGSSGKYSTVQVITNNIDDTKFNKLYRRHRIRGHGLVMQLKVSSIDGQPFNIMGWSMYETQNQSV